MSPISLRARRTVIAIVLAVLVGLTGLAASSALNGSTNGAPQPVAAACQGGGGC